MLGKKNFNRQRFEILFLFFPEVFDISCKLSRGETLHEVSNPIFWEKNQKRIRFSSAELAQRVVLVKTL